MHIATKLDLREEMKAIVAAFVGGARYGAKIRLPHALVMTALFRHDQTPAQKITAVLRLTRKHALNLGMFAAVYKTVLLLLKMASKHLHSSSSYFTKGRGGLLHEVGRVILQVLGEYLKVNRLSLESIKFHQSHLKQRFLFGTNQDGGRVGQRLVEKPPGYPIRYHHALIAGFIGGYCVWGSSNSVNVQVNLYLLSRIIVAAGKRFGWTFEDSRKYPVFASIVWGVVMLLFEESPESLHSSLRNSMEEIYRFELPE